MGENLPKIHLLNSTVYEKNLDSMGLSSPALGLYTCIWHHFQKDYELKFHLVYINDDPELTLTYFTAISIFVKLVSVLIVGPDIR